MHAATLASARLQRVLRVLSDGREHTTRDIVRRARVMAVASCVAELRVRGAEIECRQDRLGTPPVRVWLYKLTKVPTND
jgi:hypothetical protein